MKLQFLVLVAAMALSLDAFAETNKVAYHFSAYIFDTQESSKLWAQGQANTDNCETLFVPPDDYDGPYVPIPTNATVFGVVAVTDGKTSKVIPLFTWVDNSRKNHLACNGPTPRCVREEATQEELLKSTLGTIKQ